MNKPIFCILFVCLICLSSQGQQEETKSQKLPFLLQDRVASCWELTKQDLKNRNPDFFETFDSVKYFGKRVLFKRMCYDMVELCYNIINEDQTVHILEQIESRKDGQDIKLNYSYQQIVPQKLNFTKYDNSEFKIDEYSLFQQAFGNIKSFEIEVNNFYFQVNSNVSIAGTELKNYGTLYIIFVSLILVVVVVIIILKIYDAQNKSIKRQKKKSKGQ